MTPLLLLNLASLLLLGFNFTLLQDGRKNRKKSLEILGNAQAKYEQAGKFLDEALAYNDKAKEIYRVAHDHLEKVKREC